MGLQTGKGGVAGDGDRLLRELEVADLINMSVRTVRDWRLTGAGPPFVRVSGRCVRYRRADLDSWIAARVVRSTSEASRQTAGHQG
ncbi:MAG: helix-turn-helix domain-containing protein [Planctomycetes bacterium]|nr:helix-turn-helix domain-containing protein [Planctomycetota bacterium]